MSERKRPDDDEFCALEDTKNAAYKERNALVCALSKLWPSHLALHPSDDETWDPEWMTIVCIHSPVGQLTWHLHDSDVPAFSHISVRCGDWDFHTTEEKYARLAKLEPRPTESGAF
jgi:hypothetical protein